MVLLVEDIYKSPNGDRWRLFRDTASGRAFVCHEPNLASGGRVTDSGVEEFLSQNGSGPEYGALRRMVEKPGEIADQYDRACQHIAERPTDAASQESS
jgi:hypothetical protein